jgi:hypothetical protein
LNAQIEEGQERSAPVHDVRHSDEPRELVCVYFERHRIDIEHAKHQSREKNERQPIAGRR